jgi:hypothetical protein
MYVRARACIRPKQHRAHQASIVPPLADFEYDVTNNTPPPPNPTSAFLATYYRQNNNNNNNNSNSGGYCGGCGGEGYGGGGGLDIDRASPSSSPSHGLSLEGELPEYIKIKAVRAYVPVVKR